jgi:NTE family protein
MKALVLSGGASKGAFAGGMLEYMKTQMGKEYNLYYGSSTGTLLQMLASINDFKSLKEGYTSMDIDSMYEISPFKKVRNPEESGQADVNLWSVFRMAVFRKEPTFGDNRKFLKTMKEFFPYEKYIKAYDSGVDMTAAVTNMSKIKSEYYSMRKLGRDIKAYEDFMEWTWTSTCALPFTSISRKVVDASGKIIHFGKSDKAYADYYGDGGFMEHMPICKAIEDGATEIDAISLNTEGFSGELEPEFGANPLKLLSRMFEVTLREAMERDIEKAKDMAKDKSVTLNIYYAPRHLTENAMYFDKKQMLGWWKEGYDFMKENQLNKSKKEYCRVIKMRAKKFK